MLFSLFLFIFLHFTLEQSDESLIITPAYCTNPKKWGGCSSFIYTFLFHKFYRKILIFNVTKSISLLLILQLGLGLLIPLKRLI